MSEHYISKIKNPEDWSKDFCLCKVNLGLGRGCAAYYLFGYQNQTCPVMIPTPWTEYSTFSLSKIKGCKHSCTVTLLTRAEPTKKTTSPEHFLTCCCCVHGWPQVGLGCQSSCRLELACTALGQCRCTHRARRQLSWDTTPLEIWLWQTPLRPFPGSLNKTRMGTWARARLKT